MVDIEGLNDVSCFFFPGRAEPVPLRDRLRRSAHDKDRSLRHYQEHFGSQGTRLDQVGSSSRTKLFAHRLMNRFRSSMSLTITHSERRFYPQKWYNKRILLSFANFAVWFFILGIFSFFFFSSLKIIFKVAWITQNLLLLTILWDEYVVGS